MCNRLHVDFELNMYFLISCRVVHGSTMIHPNTDITPIVITPMRGCRSTTNLHATLKLNQVHHVMNVTGYNEQYSK